MVILLSVTSAAIFTAAQNDENAFRQWFEQEYNPKVGELMFKEVDASWNYETNLTEFNQEIMVSSIHMSDTSVSRYSEKVSLCGSTT